VDIEVYKDLLELRALLVDRVLEDSLVGKVFRVRREI
jgi:hypothetical protein